MRFCLFGGGNRFDKGNKGGLTFREGVQVRSFSLPSSV